MPVSPSWGGFLFFQKIKTRNEWPIANETLTGFFLKKDQITAPKVIQSRGFGPTQRQPSNPQPSTPPTIQPIISSMKRPKKDEYAPFYATYIRALPARGTAQSLLKKTWKESVAIFGALPEERGDYAYAEGKWTIKQLLIHLIDTERVFAMRVLWFMRGDRAPLPGFNQDHWMEQVDVSGRTLRDLMKEWKAVRDNTLMLLSQCSEAQSTQTGQASNWRVSVRALFFIIAGHHQHHLNVYHERYVG
jgi:hypothetical protein